MADYRYKIGDRVASIAQTGAPDPEDRGKVIERRSESSTSRGIETYVNYYLVETKDGRKIWAAEAQLEEVDS